MRPSCSKDSLELQVALRRVVRIENPRHFDQIHTGSDDGVSPSHGRTLVRSYRKLVARQIFKRHWPGVRVFTLERNHEIASVSAVRSRKMP